MKNFLPKIGWWRLFNRLFKEFLSWNIGNQLRQKCIFAQGTQNPFISRRNTRSTDDCCAINPIVWLNKQSAIGRFLEIWLQITWAQFIWVWQEPCFFGVRLIITFFKSIFNKIQPVACCFLFYFTFFYNQILIYRKNYTKFVQH